MNIKESVPKISKSLLPIARHYFKNPVVLEDEFKDKLKSLGWKELGVGSRNTIFSNDKKSYVMKVNNVLDPEYAYYVSLTKKYPNKHFPKISDLRKFKIDNKTFYIYLIEKLRPLTGPTGVSCERNFNNIATTFAMNPNATLHDVEEICFKQLFPSRKLPKMFIQQPGIIEALKIIGINYKNPKFRIFLDIHCENVMQRSNGTIVITDPYA